MKEPQDIDFVKVKYITHKPNSSHSELPSKRVRFNESHDTTPNPISNLTKQFILPPPAPIAKTNVTFSLAKQNADDQLLLEDSDSDAECTYLFAQVRV
jgi:hypothetical protein